MTPIIRVAYAHVAQAAERVLGKDKVTGSNPVVGSSSMTRDSRIALRFAVHESLSRITSFVGGD